MYGFHHPKDQDSSNNKASAPAEERTEELVRAEKEYLASLRILDEDEATRAFTDDEPEDLNHLTHQQVLRI